MPKDARASLPEPHHPHHAVEAYHLRLLHHGVGIAAFGVRHTAVERVPRIVHAAEHEAEGARVNHHRRAVGEHRPLWQSRKGENVAAHEPRHHRVLTHAPVHIYPYVPPHGVAAMPLSASISAPTKSTNDPVSLTAPTWRTSSSSENSEPPPMHPLT